MKEKRQWLASLIERTVYNNPFDGFPTLCDICDLTDVLECGNVQIVYFGLMRDAHHVNDRLIVQAELEALKVPDLVVLCRWDHHSTIAVFGLRRFLSLPEIKPYWTRHFDDEYQKKEFARLEDDVIFDKKRFPRMTLLECLSEERPDFVKTVRELIAFGGVVVGFVYYDTVDPPYEDEGDAIAEYVASKTDVHQDFAVFCRFEDHGCHGSVYHFIVRKVADVQK